MIVIHASFPIRPDKIADARNLTETLVEQSNQEDGVIDYRATADIQDENTLRFFEQYEDEAAFESHLQSAHVQELEAALPDLLAGEPEVLRFDVEAASELEM